MKQYDEKTNNQVKKLNIMNKLSFHQIMKE